jgi:hypothetical protein
MAGSSSFSFVSWVVAKWRSLFVFCVRGITGAKEASYPEQSEEAGPYGCEAAVDPGAVG